MANIMIIDDEEMMCRTLARMICKKGHNVHYALTLEEGIREVSMWMAYVLICYLIA